MKNTADVHNRLAAKRLKRFPEKRLRQCPGPDVGKVIHIRKQRHILTYLIIPAVMFSFSVWMLESAAAAALNQAVQARTAALGPIKLVKC